MIDHIARAIEHTLLKPDATAAQIDRLCEEAAEYEFHGVCINPVYVSRAVARLAKLASSDIERKHPVVVTVVGFPLGATSPAIKAEEARRALREGASEIDMVVHLGAVIDGDRAAVRADVEAVARAVHSADRPGVLKVILETAALTDEQIIMACRCCAEGEADFVKTSTGFHPAGGATIEHVRLLHKHSAPIRVKASGGIRDAATATAMIEAGAARLGTSSGVAILRELHEKV
jgi:deoxyribose-phosphate aldolase